MLVFDAFAYCLHYSMVKILVLCNMQTHNGISYCRCKLCFACLMKYACLWFIGPWNSGTWKHLVWFRQPKLKQVVSGKHCVWIEIYVILFLQLVCGKECSFLKVYQVIYWVLVKPPLTLVAFLKMEVQDTRRKKYILTITTDMFCQLDDSSVIFRLWLDIYARIWQMS